jgi:hypothetical protein
VLRLGRAGQRSRARRLHLREARQIDVAQHQAEVGVRDQAPHGVDDVGAPACADLDLRHHIPDELETDLGDAHAVVAAHAGHRDGHVGLGVAAEVHRAVVDLVRLGLDKGRLGGMIGAAADDVDRRARHLDLLSAGRIELGELGDGRHLAQQAQRVDTPLVQRAGGPWQLRGPAELCLDLLDELADLGGGRLGLLALDADLRGLVLLIEEPDLERAVGEQGDAHDGDEQRDVLDEQPPAKIPQPLPRRADQPQPRRRRRPGRAEDRGPRAHSITSSTRASSDGGMSSSSAFAALRLSTNSNLVGICTGRSASFQPLRMRST